MLMKCNHFTIYVNQTIMPYTLNLYSDIHQLFLSKTGKKFIWKFKRSRIIYGPSMLSQMAGLK